MKCNFVLISVLVNSKRLNFYIKNDWDHISWLRPEEILALIINKYLRSICLIPVITEHAAAGHPWLANHATGNRWHTAFHNGTRTQKKKRKKNSKGCATRYSVLPHLRWLSITPRAPLWEFAPRATRLTSSQLPLKPLQQHRQAVTFVTSRRREWYFMVFHTVTSRTHVRAHTLRFR